MTSPRVTRLAALRQSDWGRLAEWLVLASVLAIAALISYTHLREVWRIVAAPWAGIGPLTVDGLFAAAWLRMRRRRRQDQEVGGLAFVTLLGALLVTVAGNVAAAFPGWVAEQRDYVAPVVYAWAAIAFAFVWELVTGHARQAPASHVAAGGVRVAVEPMEVAEVQATDLAAEPAGAGERLVSLEQRVAHLVHVEGFGRPRLAKALQIRDTDARRLLDTHRADCQECQEATG